MNLSTESLKVSGKKQGDDYVYHIVIPCNCMAEVKLPGEKARKLPWEAMNLYSR